ncbi:MAG: ABC transporter permease [Acidobacteria bacterium]|nr:ABC transporter permease [Acidobacteriota bacterium]
MASSLTNPLANMAMLSSKPETYWGLVLRQFRRNRIAMVAFFFVLALFLLAILAPFLADNKPIVLRGAYRGLYTQRYEEWKRGGHPELIALLRTAGPDAASDPQGVEFRMQTVERQLQFIASQLPFEGADRKWIGAYRAQVDGFLSALPEDRATRLVNVEKVGEEIATAFAPEKVTLDRHYYWPVLDSLGLTDAFLLWFAALLIAIAAIRMFLPPSSLPSKRVLLFVLLGVPLVMAILHRAAHPPVFDSLDYKRDILSGQIEMDFALFPPVAYGINEDHLADKYIAPGARYWMGTDGNGRDLLTRMIWGARISLTVGFVAVAIYVAIGVFLGALAGYFRGWVDLVISRAIEIMECFPSFFLILAVLAFLQPSMWNIMIVIGITSWTVEARLVRGEFLRLADQEFVLAARGLGVSDRRTIFRHILPNGLAPVLVAASFGIASAILIESSLSFLGFGISIPIPSWGGILNEARESFRYWWITLFPGLAIFSTVTAYNLIGEGVRDAIDPRLKV